MESDDGVYFYEVGSSDPPAYIGRDGKVIAGGYDLSKLLTFKTTRDAVEFYTMTNGCVNGCRLRLRSNVRHASDSQPSNDDSRKPA
jgi:hypothetical protein